MKKKPLILAIDDEQAILQTLQESLEDEDYHVETLSDGHKALDTIGRLIPDLVLLDIFMPHCNGLDLLKKITKQFPKQHVIMMSGFGTIQIALEAIKHGALDFIEKPLSLDEVLEKLSFLRLHSNKDNLQNTPKSHNFEAHGIVGRSYLFLELMNYISLVAPLNLPTLIYGDRGTGKTLIAHYIHKKSSHKKSDFTLIDCSQEKNLEASLFKERGTLFLKNIHDLSTESQATVLDNISKEKRVIASTQSDLFKHAQAKKFNMSLFCRLQALPIEVPALNKRRYDIPLLINHFIAQANKNHDSATTLTPSAIRLLRNHDWTHNVSQLKEYLDNLVALADNPQKVFGSRHLHAILPEKGAAFIDEQVFSRFNSLDEATNSFQRNYLLHLLRHHRYNLNQLSTILSLNISQLRDKMIKLDINVG